MIAVALCVPTFLSCRGHSRKQVLEIDSREKSIVTDHACDGPRSSILAGSRIRDAELIVFDDGETQYHTSETTLCAEDREQSVPDSRWGYRWPTRTEQTFYGKISRLDLWRLKRLLNRDDVKGSKKATPIPVWPLVISSSQSIVLRDSRRSELLVSSPHSNGPRMFHSRR